MLDLEEFWAAILSEDGERIREAWRTLATDEAHAVMAHLEVMAADEEYSEGQRRAARAAVAVIKRRYSSEAA